MKMISTMVGKVEQATGWISLAEYFPAEAEYLKKIKAQILIENGLPVRVSVVIRDECERHERSSLLEAIPLVTGHWIELGDWQAAEGNCEWVCNLELADTQPTHKITFTPVDRKPRIYLVYLHAEEGETDGPAYTLEEWSAREKADWERDDGEWLFRGMAAPSNGTVEVTQLTH